MHLPHTRGDEPLVKLFSSLDKLHLPHTRGDEPAEIVRMIFSLYHLPHTRGDEPDATPSVSAFTYICPTRVGMNRL